jgi:hypothetical protein
MGAAVLFLLVSVFILAYQVDRLRQRVKNLEQAKKDPP